MNSKYPFKAALTAALALLCVAPFSRHFGAARADTGPAPLPCTTRIAKWQDDKKAAFLLMFDDGWPSHWQVAVPELAKRHLTATFYIVPGKGEFKAFEKKWLTDVPEAGMVVGDHTFTHTGIKTPDKADFEIGDCQRYILKNYPGKTPRLISFAQPGGVPWAISRSDEDAMLAKYNLIERPPFEGHGAVYHLQTTDQMLALADKAIASGGMEYLVIHGVERITPNWGYQDFWALKQSIFLPLLDGLQQRSDRGDLWVTDHISECKYVAELAGAQVTMQGASGTAIRLQLTTTTDPVLYDLPLTLVTQVPAKWAACKVTQGDQTAVVPVTNGFATYHAVPGAEPIQLAPAANPQSNPGAKGV